MGFKVEVYLLRHGASTANEKMLVCGACDYPLSPRGRMQAELISKHLSGVSFDYIYVSPLSRARNTISKIKNKNKIEICDELKELNTGSVSHITLPELWLRDDRYRKPWIHPELRYPDGETFYEMTSRVIAWYKKQEVKWSAENKILITGHEGTLRTIYMYLFGLDLASYPDFKIGNCDYLKFEIVGGKIDEYLHCELKDIEGGQ